MPTVMNGMAVWHSIIRNVARCGGPHLRSQATLALTGLCIPFHSLINMRSVCIKGSMATVRMMPAARVPHGRTFLSITAAKRKTGGGGGGGGGSAPGVRTVIAARVHNFACSGTEVLRYHAARCSFIVDLLVLKSPNGLWFRRGLCH